MMKFEYRDSRLLRFRDFFGNSSAFILLAGLTVAALWLLVAPAILGSSTDAPGSVIAADSNVITGGVIDRPAPRDAPH